MKKKIILSLIALLFTFATAFSQLGIRAGLNMANELRSFDEKGISELLNSHNLSGFHAGLVYQANSSSGLGFEIGALFSQKGGSFSLDSTSAVINSLVDVYQQINYVEIPLNLRYTLGLGGPIALFASGGVYGGCVIQSKTTIKTDVFGKFEKSENFDDFMDRIDYGFTVGAGLEFINKIQLGVNWSQGLQKREENESLLKLLEDKTNTIFPNIKPKTNNRVFSVSLTYLF